MPAKRCRLFVNMVIIGMVMSDSFGDGGKSEVGDDRIKAFGGVCLSVGVRVRVRVGFIRANWRDAVGG